MLAVYEVEGKPYLEVRKFNQRLRLKKEKHPGPPSNPECLSHDGQMPGRCQSNDGLKRREVEVETKRYRNHLDADSDAEPREALPPQLAATDGKGGEAEEHGTDEEFWGHISRCWPDINLKREIEAMNAYLRKKGDSRPITRRFVLAWMRKTSPEVKPPEIKPRHLDGIDEEEAFRWRSQTYPESVNINPTIADFPFKEWPQSVQKEYRDYLTSLKRSC